MLCRRHVSTVYKGRLLTGVVLVHTKSYLEVTITSPYKKLSMGCHLPSSKGKLNEHELQHQCAYLLNDLYDMADATFAPSAAWACAS